MFFKGFAHERPRPRARQVQAEEAFLNNTVYLKELDPFMDSFSRMVPANEQGSSRSFLIFYASLSLLPYLPPGESMISRPNYASFQLAILYYVLHVVIVVV